MQHQNYNHNFRNKLGASRKSYHVFAVELEFLIETPKEKDEVMQAIDALELPHFNAMEVLGHKTVEDVEGEIDAEAERRKARY